MEVGDVGLRHRQARVHVDAVGFHPADRVRAAVPHHDVAVFTLRRLVDERTKLAIVEALIAFRHRRDLADLHRRLLLRVRLDLENVDGVTNAGAISMTDEDAVAADAETAGVACAIEVATLPGPRGRVLHRGHREHPVQFLEVAEQVQIFFELGGAGSRVFLGRGRIDHALTVDPNRRHLRHRRLERARLTAGGILGKVDALRAGGRRRPGKRVVRQAQAAGEHGPHATRILGCVHGCLLEIVNTSNCKN